ncbi:MAG: M61 family metallopeptidase [Planctomycetia bacterium]|nr:M61 family metallopeptidase [Planctomycetia bacterium]MBL6914265.1 M61 family metallopeptidase [Planctomycetota bacterium]
MGIIGLILATFLVAAPTKPASDLLGPPAASYVIDLKDISRHRIHVELACPRKANEDLEIWMPVWTPGSYKVRDYARHIETISATDETGTEIPITKVRKNTWNISAGTGKVRVSYTLYCRLLTVRTNFVEKDGGFLNGAPTFLIPRGTTGPFDFAFADLQQESGFQKICTLPRIGNSWRAADVDTLCDSPILIGQPKVLPFVVEEIPHDLIHLGDTSTWDMEGSREAIESLTKEMVSFWGQIPYSRYQFMNVIAEAGGGLEHKDCTLMLTSRWSWNDEDRRRGWYGLVSHELFHAWNGKRLRPVALGPFDYEREVLTPDLWMVEGFTSYYDDLIVARAGLMNSDQYLKRLSDQIEDIRTTPGRQVRPLSEASTDAWIRYYQSDENSVNSQISYYTKGALVAWLLDGTIREASDHQRSLDDAMRLAYERYSGTAGYTPEQLREVFEEVAGKSLDEFFSNYLDGTMDLDYDVVLKTFGLKFKSPKKDDDEDKKPDAGWLGIDARDSSGRWVVRAVPRGTPAYEVGLNVGDEIIALDAYRASAKSWSNICRQYLPGSSATLTIARRGRLVTLNVEFSTKPKDLWNLQIDSEAPEEVALRRSTWWGKAEPEKTEEPETEDPPLETDSESTQD